MPITVVEQSKAWTVFVCLNTGIMSSNPTQGMNVYVSLFVLSCAQVAALRWTDPSSKESYRLCVGLRKWQKTAKFQQKDCRVIDR
jgi:hypothetical protein